MDISNKKINPIKNRYMFLENSTTKNVMLILLNICITPFKVNSTRLSEPSELFKISSFAKNLIRLRHFSKNLHASSVYIYTVLYCRFKGCTVGHKWYKTY